MEVEAFVKEDKVFGVVPGFSSQGKLVKLSLAGEEETHCEPAPAEAALYAQAWSVVLR